MTLISKLFLTFLLFLVVLFSPVILLFQLIRDEVYGFYRHEFIPALKSDWNKIWKYSQNPRTDKPLI